MFFWCNPVRQRSSWAEPWWVRKILSRMKSATEPFRGASGRSLPQGDIVRIPPKVPHQLLLDGSPEFTYFVIKVKGY